MTVSHDHLKISVGAEIVIGFTIVMKCTLWIKKKKNCCQFRKYPLVNAERSQVRSRGRAEDSLGRWTSLYVQRQQRNIVSGSYKPQ